MISSCEMKEFITSEVNLVFSLSNSIDLSQEMQLLTNIRRSKPELAKKIIEKNELLLSICRNGSLSQLYKYIAIYDHCDVNNIERPLCYFVIKGFIAALTNRHFIICDQMIKNGFPLNSLRSIIPTMPPILSQCFSQLIQDEEGDARSVQIINYLLLKDCDINTQDSTSWETPIFMAIRCQFLECIECLISHGADVNVVAREDLMPLTLANKLSEENNKNYIYSNIVSLLQFHGASTSWRKQPIEVQRVNFNSSHSNKIENPDLSSLVNHLQISHLDNEPSGQLFSTD